MCDCGSQKLPRLHRIVEIIAERISDRIRHHDGTCKVNDRIHFVPIHHTVEQGAVADVTDDKLDTFRDH